jgi:signal transduction histidine kinase
VGLSVLIFILTIGFLKLWGTRVELLKQLDRQKDELISIVSHQLATPITSLKWNVEILLDGDTGPLNEQQKKELQVMQSSTNNLADLVSMMLDVSRLELGRMKVDRTDVDVRKLFEETIEMVRPKALEKKQTLEVVLGEMPTARLDKRLTRMTLENLLTNAIKYTPDRGKVIVTAQVNKDVLHYQVRDTGFGIPKKEQSQIFGKLFRASNVQTVPGNGLGLFAAKGAVEAQCGRIHFESSPGWGTVFTVDLPLTEEASLPASPKKKGCLSWRTRAR